MSFRRPLALVALLAAVLPGTASAGDVRVVQRDEPLGAVVSGLARPAPLEFTLVGLHWRGAGEVWFRTATAGGSWSAWRPGRPEDEDLPDLTADEGKVAAGWKVGNPWWTGPATRIEYRVEGEVTRLRTFFVSSPVTAEDRARAADLAAPALSSPAAVAAAAPRPPIVRRAGWQADETIVRGSPTIADRLRFAVVHHTAGTNAYSAAESAAIVRGIQRYHVVGNGWDDIGYNFLVDKYGQVFEGRRGGITQNVVGAHAQGFNTGSVGVSLLGTYDSASVPAAARAAIESLLAWRLDVGHVDPLAVVDAVSNGNPKFAAGAKVRLRAISGHRDTGYTSCPGTRLYGQLGAVAKTVSRTGLPKLYDPVAAGQVGAPVRFTARLSTSLPWLVEVKDPAGAVVAHGSGTGTAVDWTWNATGVPIQAYRYEMSAGPDLRPAAGPVPGPLPLAVAGLAAKPAVLTPNGDGNGERTTISFSVNRQAVVGVKVVDAVSGALVRTLAAPGARPAGVLSLTWDGTLAGGAPAAEGRYRVDVTADAGIEHATASAALTVDRTLGGMTVSSAVLSPNGDGRLERLRVAFALTRRATVRLEIRRKGAVVRSLKAGRLSAGAQRLVWDGRLENGKRPPDGTYSAVVLATTSLGTRSLALPLTLDGTRPTVRVLSFRRQSGVNRLRLTVSEPATVKVWFGRKTWSDGGTIVRALPAGAASFRLPPTAAAVRIVATDEARNASAAAAARRGR